jgi:translation initiation factor 2 subunit 3
MPGDDKSKKYREESDSEEEEEEEIFPKLDIDVSKLTPLSPEVISKQVSAALALAFSLSFSGNALRLP